MKEKIIIEGKPTSVKIMPTILIIIGLIIGVGVSWYLIECREDLSIILASIIIGAIPLFAGLTLWFYVKNCAICVTDKRIYGQAAFGMRVDIPIDSVSAVGLIGWLNGISVASSSGSLKFLYILNSDAIHSAISNLLINRQKTSFAAAIPDSAADELKKYKELLDTGVITQEEFDAKKKQLLGL